MRPDGAFSPDKRNRRMTPDEARGDEMLITICGDLFAAGFDTAAMAQRMVVPEAACFACAAGGAGAPKGDDMTNSSENTYARYMAALHAMQSGVAMDLENGSTSASPKHLRVGVNSAMVEHSALVQLLVAKGLFTLDEYGAAMADAMEAEQRRYEKELSAKFSTNVTLA